MADDRWDAGTWDGTRREQLRRSLRLTVRERLQNLEGLYATGERLADAGREAHDRAPDAPGTIRLEGCRPTPLASYLKALGVLRLIVEQEADPEARGHWDGDRFVLTTRLDRDELVRFFLEEYEPTPVIGPWGARSGFYEGPAETSARKALDRINSSDTARLEPYRDAIGAVRTMLKKNGFNDKPSTASGKTRLLKLSRAELPEPIVPWLDVCFVLTSERTLWPPMLGTGGNEGSGSYPKTFAELVVACIIDRVADGALLPSLYSVGNPVATFSSTPGQFDPMASGGPNSDSSLSANTALNPWDFLLCLEGTLLFAAAATRRLQNEAKAGLSLPFTVRATGAGDPRTSLDEEAGAYNETWLPLWSVPVGLAELRATLGEGRAQVGRRFARDGVDFARAVGMLGLSRGIDAFQRYAFLKRAGGDYHFAIPLNRVPVRRNVTAALIEQLEDRDWLFRFRGLVRRSPARLQALGRRLDDALFDLALRGDASPRHAQEVLVLLGGCMRYLAVSPEAQGDCRPVPLLDEEWVRTANDGSAEFLLAAGLAGLHARSTDGAVTLPMVMHVAPVQEDPRSWTNGLGHQVTWGHGALEPNLAQILKRRLLTARSLEFPDRPLAGWAAAPLWAVGAWIGGRVDSPRIADLMLGLTLARSPIQLGGFTTAGTAQPVPGAYRVLKPFFTTHAQLERIGLIEPDERLPLPETLVRSLRTGDVEAAIQTATRRLRASGYTVPDHVAPSYAHGERLLAALMTPVSDRELRPLLSGLLVRSGDIATTHEPMEDHHAR